jgi:hypothetical protein
LRYDAPPFVERHNESGSFHLCAAQEVIGHGRSIACLSSIFLKMMLNAARSRRSIPAFGGLSNMRRYFQRIFVVCFFALLLSCLAQLPATAQNTYGGIEGRATSIEGWVIPKVTIRLLNKATKQTATVETDASGNYTACLPVGTDDVLASTLGYKQSKRKSIKVDASSKALIDFVMKHDASGWVDRQHP